MRVLFASVERHRLEEVTRVQIDAVRTAVDLRRPQKHQMDHLLRQVGARRDIMMHPKQGPRTVGRHFMPDQPLNLAHAFILLCSSAQSTLARSEEHTSELQSLMRISYAVFCLKNKNK